ncbi:MAG TPA: FecR family protein, partial [Candidatus Competibacteraceae bacterium]|nr:FecR family protein [Candidatus Competibacteraceae bacterium]
MRFYAGSKPLVLSFAFLFGLLLNVATLAAPEAIGTLAESRGKVEINGAAVTPGAELRLGMRVATGSSSQAVLKFADGQTVVVGPESVFWIKDYRYAGNKPQENRFSAELVEGGMRFISGALAKETPQAVEVDTPVATIGVRGTDFTAVLGSLCMMVREGNVVVTSGGQSIVAAPGQILFVQDKLTPPRFIPAPELRAPCAVIQDSATAPPRATASCACGILTRQNASGVYEFSLPGAAGGAGAGGGAG